MVLGILLSITAIGVVCWLLFTLAIYALPLFAGITVGTWAYGTGAGWPGGIVVGLLAAGLMLGVGQFLFAFARPVWLRLTIGLVFAAPAAVAGYHAVHGIAKHAMPSETWQFIFSVVGAIASARRPGFGSPVPSPLDPGGTSLGADVRRAMSRRTTGRIEAFLSIAIGADKDQGGYGPSDPGRKAAAR